MKKPIGILIAEKRREKGMTQAQLAQQMGVTDKAVSKWERELSLPDTASIPHLAEILGVSVEQLMKGENKASPARQRVQEITRLALRAAGLAMGIAVTALTALGQLEAETGMVLLGIGLAAVSLHLLEEKP